MRNIRSYHIIILLLLAACSKMDATYIDFVKNGETIYTGKVDSLKTASGNKRIELSWQILTDPNIANCKIFWNQRRDSAIVPVKGQGQFEIIKHMITPIKEGTYTFDVYTYDAKGNSSIKVSQQGYVFGEQYQASLLTRPVRSAKLTGTDAQVIWFAGESQVLSMELKYTDNTGALKNIRIPAAQDTAVLKGFTKGQAFEYRTIFAPNATAIDSFYTAFSSIIIN